jgi:hypothetical protein
MAYFQKVLLKIFKQIGNFLMLEFTLSSCAACLPESIRTRQNALQQTTEILLRNAH